MASGGYGSRRAMLGLAAAVCVCPLRMDARITSTVSKRGFFDEWLPQAAPAGGQGLVQYFGGKDDAPAPLSPSASAHALLAALRCGQRQLAAQLGDGLVYWQRKTAASMPPVVRGGIPSEVVPTAAGWAPGDHFYACDALITIAALLRLYAVTGHDRYAQTAVDVGTWLRGSLFDGRRHGVWARNYGAPMQFMRADGAINNAIHTGVDLLWLEEALRTLDPLDRGAGWMQWRAEALAFYQAAQTETGGWFDHFKPLSYRSVAGRWYGFRGASSIVADNSMMSALALQRSGERAGVDRFLAWLQPRADGLLAGYLDLETAQPKFVFGDAPYFDIVCTAMLRNLYVLRGETERANACQGTLAACQAANGGWYWGLTIESLKPIEPEQAVNTGAWAVADLV